MLESKLSPSIETDDCYYFFSMLTDRFLPLNERWQKGLEKRFNKPCKPIYILSFKHSDQFEEENYIVLNERLQETHKQTGRTDLMNLIYPEDLNKQFSRSPQIKELTKKLIKKQGTVCVLGFTSVWLELDDPNIIVLGPDAGVAGKYDAKISHSQTFQKLGMQTIPVTLHQTIEDLRQSNPDYPLFLSAMYSSGGIESKAIFTPSELEAYYVNLRPINKTEALIAARYVDDIVLAPNSTAIVTNDGKTTLLCISDQILRNNQYMGNIYPSAMSNEQTKQVQTMTETVGKYLYEQGFRGLFGLDFLITKSGHCYPVDLNPRRQGGYYCVAMSSPYDVVELELAVIFDEPTPEFSYDNFQVTYCWAHSKLSPYYPNVKIVNELNDGSPTEPFTSIGSTYKAVYYSAGYTLMVGNPGFYLTSGKSYKEIKQRLYEETEKAISQSYELYEG